MIYHRDTENTEFFSLCVSIVSKPRTIIAESIWSANGQLVKFKEGYNANHHIKERQERYKN